MISHALFTGILTVAQPGLNPNDPEVRDTE
jgi:hypothetical protein